ncbi:hypothetical protein [Parvibaculum sp.]|uniref:hypothetical protein n=1 Tax=Parvibaculum sp. TaxID=2024848 RepID=UPI0026327B42|nr:hypothetical protein [Parvibaculum sp.]MCW5727261.1 hypothetical protein [Parvibaculum sp.]
MTKAHEFAGGVYKMRAPDGTVIMRTDRAMLAVLGRKSGTLTVPQRTPENSGSAPLLKSQDHNLGAVPVGATVVLGAVRVTTATDFLLANKPQEFSGTVLLNGLGFKASGFAFTVMIWQSAAPLISGGNAFIRERWWNATSGTIPGYTQQNIPSFNLQYDLRLCGWVGGA